MWVCLLTWDCFLHYNFHNHDNMAYKKMFNLVKWGVELKMNWLNWTIPISSGFQFQFNSNSKSFNSIPIQFMLNWIELIINSNSIHELIRALHVLTTGHHVRCNVCSGSRWSYLTKGLAFYVDLKSLHWIYFVNNIYINQFSVWCYKVKKKELLSKMSQNFVDQIWFCTRLIKVSLFLS